MYTFIAFLILLYEDNHSPYLILFIFATTLAVCASVWAFMKSAKSLNRFMALLAGFVAGVAINRISESTWDMAAYYGLPPGPINNPGRQSILAALYPAKHNYIYFVADNNGRHRFARNYEEHQKNVRLYRKAKQLAKNGGK